MRNGRHEYTPAGTPRDARIAAEESPERGSRGRCTSSKGIHLQSRTALNMSSAALWQQAEYPGMGQALSPDISETQLIELRRQWAESRNVLAQRAIKDRDEIERLTQLLYEREQESLSRLRASAEGSHISLPAEVVPVGWPAPPAAYLTLSDEDLTALDPDTA